MIRIDYLPLIHNSCVIQTACLPKRRRGPLLHWPTLSPPWVRRRGDSSANAPQLLLVKLTNLHSTDRS